MRTHSRALQGGFTLVEIMVVVIILGLLATIVTQNVITHADDARTEKAKADLEQIASAMTLYVVKNGNLPSDGIAALTREDVNGEQWIRISKDPWKSDYVFVPGHGKKFVVLSVGPDKLQDTDDDIRVPRTEEK